MMRVMVALALPALASGVTCSQDLCCAPIAGKCTGNTGGTGDVACVAGTINKGAAVDGTDAGACCETACAASVCGTGFSTKTDFATIVGATTGLCCDADITGKCTGNTGGTGDVACVAGKINKGAAVDGTDAGACCETACAASVCGTGFSTKTDFAAIVGATTGLCCDADITGKCTGNTGGTGDVACGTGKINKGVGTDGTTTTACCETACVATLCVAAAGFSTKVDFATIVGATTGLCCDKTGWCNMNTVATENFACSATSTAVIQNKLCTPAVKETTSGAATATVAASALALVAALL